MKKLCIVFALLPALLSGCGKSKTAIPLCRVVTQVDVEWDQEEEHRRYSLTAMDEVRPILIYLRTLRPMGQPTADPERLEEDAWKIVVHRSDGSSRIYRQRGAEYLSRDSSPWELINQAGGSRLEPLIRGMKGEYF